MPLGSRLFLTRRETRKQSLCADSQKSFPRHDLSLLFGHCRRNCARRNEGRENVRRRVFGSKERRRERVERRENRDNRPLSCRSWSYVFLLLRHHCLLQPRSNSLAHFYFVTTSISIVQPIRPFVPLRGYTGQYFDAAPSNDQLFFSSFQVNRATRYLIHRCISYFQLLCSQFLFVR